MATATDQQFAATLNWVIVRDGPGTWAKNADWDEYFISVVNETGDEIQIIDLTIVVSLGTRLASNSVRKELVKGSKETIKRYKDSNLKVKAGFGGGSLIATGAAMAVGGTATVAAAASTVGMGTATAAAGGAIIVGAGAVLLAPVFVLAGMGRAYDNHKVTQEIERRHTILPATVISQQPVILDIFFPLAPSPSQLEITYLVAGAKKTLVLNTGKALKGLHLVQEG